MVDGQRVGLLICTRQLSDGRQVVVVKSAAEHSSAHDAGLRAGAP